MTSFDRISSCASASVRRFFRNRNLLLWMIVTPVFLTLVSGSLICLIEDEGGDSVTTIYVQDNCNNRYSEKIIEELNEQFSTRPIDPDVDIQQYIENYPDRYILSIPKDLSAWIAYGTVTSKYPINLYYQDSVYNITIEKSASYEGEPTVSLPFSQDIYDRMYKTLSGGSESPYHNYLGCIMTVCSMMIVLSTVIAGETFDRSNNITHMKRFSGLRNTEWCISQMLWVWIPGVISATIAYGVINLFHTISPTPLMFLAAALCSICQVPVALILSTLITSNASSNLVSSILVLPTLLISGGIMPLNLMPNLYQQIASLLPTTYFMKAIRQSCWNIEDMLTVLAVAAVFIIVVSTLWILLLRMQNKRIESR